MIQDHSDYGASKEPLDTAHGVRDQRVDLNCKRIVRAED